MPTEVVSRETAMPSIYNISSRQEQGKAPHLMVYYLKKVSLQMCRLSQFYIQVDFSDFQRKDHDLMIYQSKKKQKDVGLELSFKCLKKEIVRHKGLTIFFEDLCLEHTNKTSITQHEDGFETYIKAYFLSAQFRKGVVHLKFWQYIKASMSSVTVVKDEDVTFRLPLNKKKKYSRKFYLQLTAEDIDWSVISLSDQNRRRSKLSSELIHSLHEITGLPRNKYKLRPIKVPPNSVRIVVCPGGRRRTTRSGRQRQQNTSTQNASGDRVVPPAGLPIQVTERDDIDIRPGPDKMVTSMEPVFSRTGIPPATTNLMSSIESEESLATRRQGSANVQANPRPLRPPRYPEFADQNKRQTSYATWPQSTMQDATHMANHGFFYTGRLDLVRCFQCGIGMKDWSESDEPLFEHIRHSPECSFLVELLGPELLAAYKVSLIPAGAQPATGGSTANSSVQNPSAGTRQPNTQSSTSTPATVGPSNSDSTSVSRGNALMTASSNVRSPQYSTLESRMQSFASGWPSDHAQRPEQLSDAGFFFTGYGDVCRCFTCDGGLQRWDPTDDPWIEHARWFPTCEFVIQTRGQEYVDLVQRAANDSSEDEDPAVVMQPNLESVTGAVGNLNLESDPLSSEAAQTVLEKGFSRKAVLAAIHELSAKGENEFVASSILEVLKAKTDRGEALPTDTPPNEAENTDPEKENDPEFLQEENKRLRSILKCIQCEERDANILFLPCTHHKMCEQCAEKALLCPTCGRDIDKKVKTYMS